jgi:DNA-directed RNA polymerase specialized sigma24 family protein
VKPTNNHSSLTKREDALRTIYNQYGGALLGYITGIVNDHAEAENYFVEIFKRISRFAEELIRPEVNTWLRLQQLAKNFLYKNTQPALNSADTEFVAPGQSNNSLNLLTAEQKYIFCSIYYGNRSIESLAQEMRIAKDDIRRRLREAFSVIRNGQ